MGSWRVVSMRGKIGSVDTGTRGLESTMAVTSAKNVVNTSWTSCWDVMPVSTESSICLILPIMRSHLPPMCEAWGGLNTQVHPLSIKNDCIALLLQCLESIPRSSHTSKKLVPWSDLNCLTVASTSCFLAHLSDFYWLFHHTYKLNTKRIIAPPAGRSSLPAQ